MGTKLVCIKFLSLFVIITIAAELIVEHKVLRNRVLLLHAKQNLLSQPKGSEIGKRSQLDISDRKPICNRELLPFSHCMAVFGCLDVVLIALLGAGSLQKSRIYVLGHSVY